MSDDKNRNKNNQSSIDKLEEDLYSRKTTAKPSEHQINLKRKDYQVPESWDDSSTENLPKEPKKDLGEEISQSNNSKKPFSHKVLLISLVFLIFAFAVGGYLFFSNSGAFSPRNVEININGPSSVDGGEEFVFDVSIENGNSLPLRDVSFVIEYPQGTRSSEDLSEILSSQRENLGDIEAGSESSLRFRAIMFGEVDDVRPVRVEIEYGVPGSTSRFSQDEIYEVTIKSTPVVLSLSLPSDVNPVQDIELSLNVRSNTNQVLQNVLIEADYPFGFTFSESDPEPDHENNLWLLGDLEPGEERDITVKGRVSGQVNDDKTFNFHAGLESQENPNTAEVNLVSLTESSRVIESFMELALTLGGTEGIEYETRAGRGVSGVISWNNNTGENVTDLRIVVDLEGDIFDRTSVRAGQGGFFRSIDNQIVWDRNVLPALSSINPGESGSASFNLTILPTDELGLEEIRENLDMFITARISGTKISDSRPPEDLSSFITRRVMLTTNMELDSKIFYSTGPFQNQGPIPPRAEQETTYTITWETSSTLNDIEGAQVRATLPIYVEWLGTISPESENVTYNPADRSVTWNVGEVQSGSGIRTSPNRVAFQVSFLPSLGQLNSTPVIVRDPVMTGTDSFTGVTLQDSEPNLTTRLRDDPVYSSTSDARVVQ